LAKSGLPGLFSIHIALLKNGLQKAKKRQSITFSNKLIKTHRKAQVKRLRLDI
jgi:hypothetical protein